MENPGKVDITKIVSERFGDPRDCTNLDDLIGRSVNGETQRYRKMDWVTRKMDISRIASVIKLVQEQQQGGGPLKVVDIGGLNGFLGRLILDDLDQKVAGNVAIDVVDPNKPVMDYAQEYYRDKESRLNFFPEKAEDYVKHAGSADVVICSWMRPEMDLRPTIEKLKPKVIIFVKDISGDAGQPRSYIDENGYSQSAAWLGFSGHDIDAIRDEPESDWDFINNVVLVMTTEELPAKKVRETLSGQSIDQYGEKYPWEKELPVTTKGLRVHDREDFDKWKQTEDD